MHLHPVLLPASAVCFVLACGVMALVRPPHQDRAYWASIVLFLLSQLMAIAALAPHTPP